MTIGKRSLDIGPMTAATSLLRRLPFFWLALCVAGSGGASSIVPGVERDAEEAAGELFVTRESDAGRDRRTASPKPFCSAATASDRAIRDRISPDRPACVGRRFLSLRASEIRIQV